jgi:hypothetical protein
MQIVIELYLNIHASFSNILHGEYVMIFVDLDTFFRAIRLVFSRKWRSPRRVIWTFISIFSVTAVYMVNVLFRLLDEILFPGYRAARARPPLIITASPRSGTTFLNRLLCFDKKTFVYFRLYHTLFPSITIWRIIDFFIWIDRAAGGVLSKIIRMMNHVFFRGWENIHAMGLQRPEEDEALFLFNFATPAVYMLFPFFEEMPELGSVDRLPEWKRKEIARYYEGCVKRLIYAYGGEDATFLLKSVMFTGRMNTLLEVFPDARVVYLVRDLREVLPSTIDMFSAFWRVHSPEIPKDSDLARQWARLSIEYYRTFREQRDLIKPSNYLAVLYADLVADPAGTVKKIYQAFNLTLTPAFLARLREEAANQHDFRSNHEYSLAEYGIDPDHICRELGDIYDEYGLPRETPQGDGYAAERKRREN